jgi:hypothetical protein
MPHRDQMTSAGPWTWPWRVVSRALASGVLLAGVACDSPTKPAPVARVTITPTVSTLIVGSAELLKAQTLDAKGGTLTGRVVTWSSRNSTVASVATDGFVTSVSPGTVQIDATSEGVVGSATITVLPVPIASVTVTLPSAFVVAGNTLQAAATARDAAGGVLANRPIVWSTTDASVATVTSAGLITAVAPGVVSVVASSEGQSGSASLTVQSPAASISAISPATLIPGSTATITVSGFDPSTGGTLVTIRGAAAPIVSATGNQIVARVPCVPSGAADVRVTNANISAITQSHAVTATPRTVALGQALILTSSAAASCSEFAPTGGPARYLIAVFSAATSQNTLTSVDVSGNPPAPGARAAIVAPIRSPAAVAPDLQTPMDDALRRHDAQHALVMERNRRDYERLSAAMRALSPSARASALRQSRLRAATDVAEGDMRTVYFTFSGGCSDTTRAMRARAIRVGTRAVIWEDSANTVQSLALPELAAYYVRIGQIYDQDQHEVIRRSFADPLLRDGVTDNDGKIHMVFSQRLNNTGAAAYVTSCDQFPAGVSPGSNFGQYFYGNVPTISTPNINSTASPDGWFYFMVRTVVHEVKHIASMSARVANNSPSFEQSWLEEGTARIAEEMWVRESLHHIPWKGNIGFGTAATNGLYCDFHPTDATCNAADPLRRPSYGMRRQFNEIRNKLLEPWNWSPFGDGTGQSGAVFYNTTWSLVRYVADRYATADTTFLRTLTNSTVTGVNNLTTVAGVSFDQLIGGWGLALFADDYPGLAAPHPDIQFPSWNLRNIYAGLNAAPAWSTRWNTPFPIAPTPLAFGAFASSVAELRGGAHAYFELSGVFTSPQVIGLAGAGGSALPSTVRLAITRLQ